MERETNVSSFSNIVSFCYIRLNYVVSRARGQHSIRKCFASYLVKQCWLRRTGTVTNDRLTAPISGDAPIL